MTWLQLGLMTAAIYGVSMGILLWLLYRAGKRREHETVQRELEAWRVWKGNGAAHLPAGREHEEGPWRHWLR